MVTPCDGTSWKTRPFGNQLSTHRSDPQPRSLAASLSVDSSGDLMLCSTELKESTVQQSRHTSFRLCHLPKNKASSKSLHLTRSQLTSRLKSVAAIFSHLSIHYSPASQIYESYFTTISCLDTQRQPFTRFCPRQAVPASRHSYDVDSIHNNMRSPLVQCKTQVHQSSILCVTKSTCCTSFFPTTPAVFILSFESVNILLPPSWGEEISINTHYM